MHLFKELKRRSVFRVAAAYMAAAWLVVEITETLFPLYGLSSAAVRLVVTLLAIGFPLSLIFSWIYELTPEGIKRDKDRGQTITVAHHTDKALDRLIIVFLAFALGYFAIDKFVFEPQRIVEITETEARAAAEKVRVQRGEIALPGKSVAVLPFINISPDPENEYFADGLTEELIGTLAKVNGLHVIARTSVFALKGSNRDVRDIGRQLHVKTVLEGSVRREQDHIRITVQLISVEDGFNLWSESYNYELSSVLVLQEKIARDIARTLQIQLPPYVDRQLTVKGTVNPEAHDSYLKGRYYWARLSEGGFLKSIEAFKRSIVIDPDYAPPHAGLATVYSFVGLFGTMPPQQAFPLSMMEADAAIALDPGLAEAYIARGMAMLLYEWDWNGARENLLLALQLSPNYSMGHWAYSQYLAVVDPPAALAPALRALSLDPLSLPLMNLVAFRYLDQGQFEEAIQMDKEMLSLDPSFPATYWNLGVIDILHGRYEEAIAELAHSVEYSGGMAQTLAMQAYAYAKSGDDVKARAVLEELEGRRESPQHGYASPLLIAYLYEGLGETEEALKWLEQAVQERDGWLVNLNSFPRFDSLRDEPRFEGVLHQLRLPENANN